MSGKWWAVAIGKASEAMMAGAGDALGDALERGLVVRKKGMHYRPWRAPSKIETFDAAHPVPDETSLEAGRRVRRFLEHAPNAARVLVLISGGASSLVEELPDTVSLAQWQRLNRWLLGSGLEIHSVNAIRRRVSRLKGGGLGRFLAGRSVVALLMSDVADDDPGAIGSGLLSSSNAVAPIETLPDWARTLVEGAVTAAPAGASPAALIQHVIANNTTAMSAALSRAAGLGLDARPGTLRLAGEAEAAGRRLIRAVQRAGLGVTVWGGETTVTLGAATGRGGRNQHPALAAAIALDGTRGLSLLAAGTDGDDGSSVFAGAVVDGDTVARGRAQGHDPVQCLVDFDSERFLRAAGATIATGATGTNVGDLAIGMRA
jgi:hydroxypyruvate reductase